MHSDPTPELPAEAFPILKQGLFANHAAIAPWPRATADAVAAFARENCERGPLEYSRWLRCEQRLRERLARLVNAASVDDIALLKNTTDGVCTVANGLPWRAGDNLVLPVGEFPSNRLPWLALEDKGVEIREVDIRSGEDPESALLARMDERTRLLAVSAIQWTDGLRLRLGRLGAACSRQGVLFFVDAIQQLGALQLDARACHIDFLAADGHKWMLAPEGIAVFYCHAGSRERLAPSQHGWRMVDNPYQFNRTQWSPSDSARRYEAGSPNTLGQVALEASLGVLQGVGMDVVESRVTANSLALAQGLSAMKGVELARPVDAGNASGIVSFRVPGKRLSELHRALARKGLICALRGDAIRLSPHYYQAGEPVSEMLNVIETCL